MPKLAQRILDLNDHVLTPMLRGFAVGDGCMGSESGVCGSGLGPWCAPTEEKKVARARRGWRVVGEQGKGQKGLQKDVGAEGENAGMEAGWRKQAAEAAWRQRCWRAFKGSSTGCANKGRWCEAVLLFWDLV